jgi:alpha-N-arabinofuranosidase
MEIRLIGFDSLSSYGSPSYYAQRMFSNYLGDIVLPVGALSTHQTYLKLVNTADNAQVVRLNLQGSPRIRSEATAIVLASGHPRDNTLSNPQKVAPVTETFGLVPPSFTYTLKPYSITVLILSTQP